MTEEESPARISYPRHRSGKLGHRILQGNPDAETRSPLGNRSVHFALGIRRCWHEFIRSRIRSARTVFESAREAVPARRTERHEMTPPGNAYRDQKHAMVQPLTSPWIGGIDRKRPEFFCRKTKGERILPDVPISFSRDACLFAFHGNTVRRR